MESTHQIAPGNGFLEDLERVALQNSESEPFSFVFFKNQDF